MHDVIHTKRLALIPSSAKHVRAELESHNAIGEMLNASVPASWPPGQYDRDAQEFFLEALQAGGDTVVGWYGWYAVRRASDAERAVLIGSGGYFGPPAEDGTVEIGYSVCPEWCGQGFATELARALVAHAFELVGVTRVIAHTNLDNPASVAVLNGSGFTQASLSDQPDTLLFQCTSANVGKR